MHHPIIQLLNDLAVAIIFISIHFIGINHKGYKGKTSTSARTFVTHDGHINDVTCIFEIVFNVRLFGRVKYASNEELDIDGFTFLLNWLFRIT